MLCVRIIQLLFFILLYISIVTCNNNEIKHRIKRKVIFSKSSKVFFRLNGKNDVLEYNSIIANGYGFRINYDLPDTLPKRRVFFKRDVENDMKSLTEKSGIGRLSCIIKHLCDIIERFRNSDNCGIFCNIGNIILRSKASEAKFFLSFLENCESHSDSCVASSKDPYLSNFD